MTVMFEELNGSLHIMEASCTKQGGLMPKGSSASGTSTHHIPAQGLQQAYQMATGAFQKLNTRFRDYGPTEKP